MDILDDVGMIGSKLVSTPIGYCTRLHQTSGTSLLDSEVSSFRKLIEKLIYLTNTWPDITFVVQHLGQFVFSPTFARQQAASRILRYLKAFSDSDWAICIDTRKSITSFSVYFGSYLISWKSKKQSIVSQSSSEAKYRAIASATCELQWLTFLLQDFHVGFTQLVFVVLWELFPSSYCSKSCLPWKN